MNLVNTYNTPKKYTDIKVRDRVLYDGNLVQIDYMISCRFTDVCKHQDKCNRMLYCISPEISLVCILDIRDLNNKEYIV